MQGPRLNAERDVGSITSESETLPEEKEDGECFHKGDLAGTVGPYDRNVFLCFKNPDAWLPHVEEDDPPKVVSIALKTRKDDITVKFISITAMCRNQKEDTNNEKSHKRCTTKLQNQTQTQRHSMPNEIKKHNFKQTFCIGRAYENPLGD
ncbi:hypothetical protein NC653_038301 [Populus alba x Populus x berolinensis]|uniref:Uncharacterized protein n=1 Tax=Populus alba x Populus x berolinensis TaxID=444605 RepID=A0AAD6LGK5_9ROSI|nr:hypothetical protein NC653_038301 [Populus alba x Populus x berolinensis]